ncbi:PAS domain-containing sensor histidine kinase [Rufibacter sp. LB8]|uniref:PAS domain-containing sensor histidine kinase n=1 Tax=Rufibacter sp. LB8 TaxID=2777781 RepID=UPI00178C29F7|nr:PAS domain-containing sensor histidine kinase [Rufibacter sp. LB8]
MEKLTSTNKARTDLFYLSLIGNSLDIVSVLDLNGLYTYVGGNMFLSLGYTAEELLGTSPYALMHPEDLEIAREKLGDILHHKTLESPNFRFKAKDGSWRWMESRLTNMLDNEYVRGIVINARDITAQVEAQTKEKETKAYFHSLFTHHPDAIFTLDKQGLIVEANQRASTLLRDSALDIVGTHFLQLVPADQKAKALNAFNGVLAGQVELFELILRTGTKDQLILSITGGPVFKNEKVTGVQFISHDITEKERIKEQVELQSLLATVTVNGVLITNKERRVQWVNDSFCRLTGYTLEEAVGQKVSELLHGPATDARTVNAIRQKMERGEAITTEILNLKKNGEEIWFSMEIIPIRDKAGEVTGYVSTQTDITDKKRTESELLQLTKELYRHNRNLQQFTYIVSHNLRAPVANAVGLSNLLLEQDHSTGVFQKTLSHLNITVKQLDSILQDLNMILSVQDQHHTVEKEPVLLAEVCQQAISILQDALQECAGQVHLQVQEDLVIHTKRAYLYSILYNLLSNAIKYRSPNRPLEVTLKAFGGELQGAVIYFSDNGLGMDLDRVGSQVFKLYKRFHRNIEGKGMGLFLVKSHVEVLGGDIKVSSKVDKGTSFTIFLKPDHPQGE